MLDFLMNVVGWIIGNALWLIIILILVGILNIGAWVFNRITKGSEKVEALMVVTTREAVVRYVPEAITPSSWGGESIDPKPVISKLFGYAVSDRRFVTWTRSGKVFLSLQTRPEIASSAQRAIEVANRELNASGFSSARARNLKVYTIPSRGTEEALKAHLVIVGNVPPPPMQFVVTMY